MSVCTFFGHRLCPDSIEPILRTTITKLIVVDKVSLFYVGNNGSFDFKVRKILSELSKTFPHITYYVVFAYIPNKKESLQYIDCAHTILPENIEKTPYKFAIIKRNEWMLEKSDFVVTYVKENFGGAAKFAALAEKKQKIIIRLSD